MIVKTLVTLQAAAKLELLFNKPSSMVSRLFLANFPFPVLIKADFLKVFAKTVLVLQSEILNQISNFNAVI